MSCGLTRSGVVIVVRSVSGVMYALSGRPTCGELREGTLGALQLIVFAMPERFWGQSLFDVRKHSPTFQIVALPREIRSDRERNTIAESLPRSKFFGLERFAFPSLSSPGVASDEDGRRDNNI